MGLLPVRVTITTEVCSYMTEHMYVHVHAHADTTCVATDVAIKVPARGQL